MFGRLIQSVRRYSYHITEKGADLFKVPSFGEGIPHIEIIEVLVYPGQIVNEGDNLVKVFAGKAIKELPSLYRIRIEQIFVRSGQTDVKIGADILSCKKVI